MLRGSSIPKVVEAMRELGFDLSGRVPHQLTSEDVEWADLVVTMGCGDACPVLPGKRYLDWNLQDPPGMPIEVVRQIRDKIAGLVEELPLTLGHRARGRDRVELVRVVEDGRLGGARGAGVVVRADRVQQLGPDSGFERRGSLLDQTQTEVHVPEQATFLGGPEHRAARQLDRAADVVQQRRREQEVGAEPRMELRQLAADRRDADGVLEQPAGVAVVALDRRRRSAADARSSSSPTSARPPP